MCEESIVIVMGTNGMYWDSRGFVQGDPEKALHFSSIQSARADVRGSHDGLTFFRMTDSWEWVEVSDELKGVE